VIGIRGFLVPLVLALLATPADAAGIDSLFGKKTKSEAQVKKLIDTVKNDTDEKKRKAAVAELREADPRVHSDVIPCLAAALQKDSSAAVRIEAADAIGSYKIAYPLGGLALEAAAELDPAREVRERAQEALWEYHLVGYRSQRGANGIAGQTPEPPIARPTAHHRPPVSPVVATDVPIPMAMPKRPPVELPAVTPPAPAAPRFPFLGPIASRRPVLDTVNLIKSAFPSAKPGNLKPVATPEPPRAQPRILSQAPLPRLHAAPLPVSAPVGEPFALPPVSEPPGEFPAAAAESSPSIKALLRLPEPLPPGPRLRY
jgi:hypothetical protein